MPERSSEPVMRAGGMLARLGNDSRIMSLFFGAGSAETEMSGAEIRAGLREALTKLGERKKVLAVPPDFTRFHSKAGELTEMAWEFYGERLRDVLPALGTHTAMPDHLIGTMVG